MIAAAWAVVVISAVVGVSGITVAVMAWGSRIASVRRCERETRGN